MRKIAINIEIYKRAARIESSSLNVHLTIRNEKRSYL